MYATTAWQAEALNGADEQGEQVLTRTPTDLPLVAASSQLELRLDYFREHSTEGGDYLPVYHCNKRIDCVHLGVKGVDFIVTHVFGAFGLVFCCGVHFT